ncbi:Ubiquitin carboxyl-terminal hydrolase 26 [Polyrhizophydium stewartii]|uniref:Ubiquitin carboxyl-terminal hydrolase 26 n=1 Tax=Polyrhizophydium stewartii TaxID=2732419 RepID=A0ABR4N2Z6_9FUNG
MLCNVHVSRTSQKRTLCFAASVDVERDECGRPCLVVDPALAEKSATPAARRAAPSEHGLCISLAQKPGKLLVADASENFQFLSRHLGALVRFELIGAKLGPLRRRMDAAIKGENLDRLKLYDGRSGPVQSKGEQSDMEPHEHSLMQLPAAKAASRPLVSTLVDVFSRLRALDRAVSVKPVKDLVSKAYSHFSSTHQQDAHEFLMACLDILGDELKETDAALLKTPVSEATLRLPEVLHMEYILEKRVVCSHCEAVVTISGCERDVPVSLPDDATFDRAIPLDSLLRASFAPEKIEHQCGRCGHSAANAHQRIRQAPRVLLVHVKRFGLERGRMVKHHQLIRVPFRLALPQHILAESAASAQDPTYALQGIISHSGQGVATGHYVYDRFDHTRGVQVRFDDSVVNQIRLQGTQYRDSSRAYVLAFVRD